MLFWGGSFLGKLWLVEGRAIESNGGDTGHEHGQNHQEDISEERKVQM